MCVSIGSKCSLTLQNSLGGAYPSDYSIFMIALTHMKLCSCVCTCDYTLLMSMCTLY